MQRVTATVYPRASGLALLAAAGAIALTGCGGAKAPSIASVGTTTSRATDTTNATGRTASSSSPPSRAQVQQSLLKYAQCMRAHGVPNFPDPSSGGGFQISPNSGIDPSSPSFKAAQATCEKYMPAGSLSPGTQTHPSPQWLAHMLKVAQCMRHHGIPDFPDPSTSVPSLGGSIVEISDIQGAVFAFPDTIDQQSPAFTRAAAACDFPLHNH